MSAGIDTYEKLLLHKNIYVAVQKDFIRNLRREIKSRYKTLSIYNRKRLKLKECTFKYMFKKYAMTFQFSRLVEIALDCGLTKETVFNNILGFRVSGSHRNGIIKIPRIIKIDEYFVEGYALYLAEGDTGLSGKKNPRKFRFTNSEISVINHFIELIRRYLPGIDFYISVIVPSSKNLQYNEKMRILQTLNVNRNKVKFCSGAYNKKVKYRICLDSSIIIDLMLSMNETVKSAASDSHSHAAAYVRGIMIGEGTAYNNKYSYVKLEMRNEKEVKFVSYLLEKLGICCTVKERHTRRGMWTVFIGRKDSILRFHRLIGFGVHEKRQLILDQIINNKIDSISVNPGVAVSTRLLVAKVEKK